MATARPLRCAFAAGALVALAACSSGTSIPRGGIAAIGLPKCSMFKAGARYTVKQLAHGCTAADGTISGGGSYDCTDHRTLYLVGPGWGYAGQPFHSGGPGADTSDTPNGPPVSKCLGTSSS